MRVGLLSETFGVAAGRAGMSSGAGMSERDESSPSTSGRGDEQQPPKLRLCRGALWYSTSRHLREQPPVRILLPLPHGLALEPMRWQMTFGGLERLR